MKKLILEDVNSSNDHKTFLFEIFQKRKKNDRISSFINLSYEEHCRFINEHPYRYWFLVKKTDRYIGTLYISNENCIGIHLLQRYQNYFELLINQVLETYEPLPAVPSVRSSNFIVNISPNNNQLETILQKMGANCIQKTFKLVKNENA